jgi:formylglycine-generating enzyme required for sulfatase activity
LPTALEWYRAALGTPDRNGAWGAEDCNLASREDAPDLTGSRPLCVSVSGAFDMVGNVWEWVEETIDEGSLDGRTLPPQGYIAGIDERGIPIATDEFAADQAYFDDYFWIESSGVRAMIRGGFWRSQTDGGQYTINAAVPPTFTGDAIGFRCARAVE